MNPEEMAERLHAAIDGDFLVGAGMGHDNAGQDVPLREASVKEVVWWAVRALNGPSDRPPLYPLLPDPVVPTNG